MDFYNGFSSLQFQNNKHMKLTNVDLIKMDLLNNIYTRKGERLKMGNYGTRIPDIVFEPLTDSVIYIISEDITQVFANDPRVELTDLKVIPIYDENAVMVFAAVNYAYLDFSGSFDIKINFLST